MQNLDLTSVLLDQWGFVSVAPKLVQTGLLALALFASVTALRMLVVRYLVARRESLDPNSLAGLLLILFPAQTGGVNEPPPPAATPSSSSHEDKPSFARSRRASLLETHLDKQLSAWSSEGAQPKLGEAEATFTAVLCVGWALDASFDGASSHTSAGGPCTPAICTPRSSTSLPPPPRPFFFSLSEPVFLMAVVDAVTIHQPY